MFTRRYIPVLSLLLTCALGSSATAAGVCNADGYTEKVLRRALTEYGEFTYAAYWPNMTGERAVLPAAFSVMSREAYEALPKEIVYEDYTCEKAVVRSRPVHASLGRISAFDVIKQVDGSEYMRPLDPSLYKRNGEFEEDYIETEAKAGTVSKTMRRPTPEVLPNGQLRVLTKPSTIVYEANCKYTIVKMETRKYIKTRTPAVIQLVPCTVSPQNSER